MSERVDKQGRAYKKSQRQIQTAVNERSDELERKLLDALLAITMLSKHSREQTAGVAQIQLSAATAGAGP